MISKWELSEFDRNTYIKIMKLIFLVLMLLCSCSQRPADNTGLPNYEMMQAAEDAGQTPSK
jgi:hypothetical protein